MSQDLLEELNRQALTLRVPASCAWDQLERTLRSDGLTLGWPPAMPALSTIGEILEARAEGLRQTLYGDPAANCVGVEATLHAGASGQGATVASRIVPRSAAGPDWKYLLLGGQGLVGRISAATLRVHRLPEHFEHASYAFKDAASAVNSMANLFHHMAIPAIAAIDATQTPLRLLLCFEGAPPLCKARADIARRLCSQGGGIDHGPEPARLFQALEEDTGRNPSVGSPLFSTDIQRFAAPWKVLAEMAMGVGSWLEQHHFTAADLGFTITLARHNAASFFLHHQHLATSQIIPLLTELEQLGALPIPPSVNGKFPSTDSVAQGLLAALQLEASPSQP